MPSITMDLSKGVIVLLLLIILLVVILPIQRSISRVHLPPRFAEELFKNFTKRFNKTYDGPEDYQKRLNYFTMALEDIANQNMQTNATAKFGVTKYSDLSRDEFLSQKLSRNLSHFMSDNLVYNKPNYTIKADDTPIHFLDENNADRFRAFYSQGLLHKNLNFIPLKVDWRDEKVLSAVRKQGKCGACWAISVVEMIEAQMMIRKSSSVRLSVQEGIDCLTNDNKGCTGGDTCNLLEWFTANKAPLLTDAEYPASGDGEPQTCKLPAIQNSTNPIKAVRIADYTCESFATDELNLLEVIANYGPVSAVVNAGPWQNYVGGVIQDDCDGSIDSVNHAVQIVGYDRGGSVPHYIIQNSWGPDYGENGYIRLAFGNNVCGIANQIAIVKLA